MNIVAASQGTVLEAALGYLEMGFSVLPVRGKQPAIQWAGLQTKRAAFSHVHNWHRAGIMPGVGIIAGAVSGGLVVIDLDGLDAVAKFEFCFPQLLNTYTVLSGSGRGKHLYFFTEENTPTTRTKGYEMRSDGCYVVAPPSIHPDSKQPYRVVNDAPILWVDTLVDVEWFIKDMIKEKAPAQAGAGKPAISRTGYGGAALSSECLRVRNATKDVNNELNRSAFKLGQLVAAGLLNYSECEAALMIAAQHLSDRDGERATLRTIKSGLNAGMTKAALYRSGLKHGN